MLNGRLAVFATQSLEMKRASIWRFVTTIPLAETRGTSCRRTVVTQRVVRGLPGAASVSVLGTCFTKQTGDMVYTMAENSWLSQLWLDA